MSKRTSTEEERHARREADRQRTREAVEALRASEGWQNWVRLRHHFRDYSLTILSWSVSSAATRCIRPSATCRFVALSRFVRLRFCSR